MESIFKEKPSTADLGAILEGIYKIGNESRSQLRDKVNPDDDEGVYFLGLLERATVFADDLGNILLHSRTGSMASAFVIGRCIMDDFITLKYVLGAKDRREEIIKINANAFREMMKKIKNLMVLNQNAFEGKFDYYPTQELITDVEAKFVGQRDGGRYLLPDSKPGSLLFKNAMQLTQMAEAAGSKTNDDVGRAFYFWGIWSGYVHFSPSTYNMEMLNQTDRENLHKNLRELFVYLYRIVRESLRYFMAELKVDVKVPPIFWSFEGKEGA
jgi:hypothetical protein